MFKKFKTQIVLVLCLCLMFICGCSARAAVQVADVNELNGLRVGVGNAWSEDYILRERDDVELYRYQDLSTMILGLKSGHIDAIGINNIVARQIAARMPSLEIVDGKVGQDEFVAFFYNDNLELMEQFNEFIAGFKGTEEYDDIIYRLNNMEEGQFAGKEVPVSGGLPSIRMVAEPSSPYTYWDFANNRAAGSDVEFARHFANYLGCGIDIEIMDYSAAVMELAYGQADMLLCALSSHYRKEVELHERALVSQPYMGVTTSLLVVGDASLFDGVPEDI